MRMISYTAPADTMTISTASGLCEGFDAVHYKYIPMRLCNDSRV
ncbi:hypothetical protein [uncultured Ruminococcus sp.]|nr:hypothetical protein [uncultured Ruminococcus sp.]